MDVDENVNMDEKKYVDVEDDLLKRQKGNGKRRFKRTCLHSEKQTYRLTVGTNNKNVKLVSYESKEIIQSTIYMIHKYILLTP